MVQTRRQYNNWVENRGVNYETSQSTCSSCSQRSEASQRSDNDNGYEPFDDDVPQGASYKPNDHCKRHRNQDGQPKQKKLPLIDVGNHYS